MFNSVKFYLETDPVNCILFDVSENFDRLFTDFYIRLTCTDGIDCPRASWQVTGVGSLWRSVIGYAVLWANYHYLLSTITCAVSSRDRPSWILQTPPLPCSDDASPGPGYRRRAKIIISVTLINQPIHISSCCPVQLKHFFGLQLVQPYFAHWFDFGRDRVSAIAVYAMS